MKETLDTANLMRELPALVKTIPIEYIKQQRWFGSKAKDITDIALKDSAVLEDKPHPILMTLIELRYQDEETEVYYLPLALQPVNSAPEVYRNPESLILEVWSSSGLFMLYDALVDEEFLKAKFHQIVTSGVIKATRGRFSFAFIQTLTDIVGTQPSYHIASLRPLKVEQSNTSVILNDSLVMKNFRRLRNGTNPDLEVPLFLTTKTKFRNIPLVAGYVEYSGNDNVHFTIASLQEFVPNHGDGWSYTLAHLHKLYEFACQQEPQPRFERAPTPADVKTATRQFSDSYLRDIYLLGQITGGLHNALASHTASPDFAPEPITDTDVKTWVSRIRSYSSEVIHALESRSASYPLPIREQIRQVISHHSFYMRKVEELAVLAEQKVWKTRYHNDYHLGQILKTPDSFAIIDFEGEPARPLEERRAKQSPLKDVAGMLRSFNYAAYSAQFDLAPTRDDEGKILEVWGETWETVTRNAFLNGYLETTGGVAAGFLPNSIEAIQKVLDIFQLDKAIYELNYELNNRPGWLEIPLKYLLSLLH